MNKESKGKAILRDITQMAFKMDYLRDPIDAFACWNVPEDFIEKWDVAYIDKISDIISANTGKDPEALKDYNAASDDDKRIMQRVSARIAMDRFRRFIESRFFSALSATFERLNIDENTSGAKRQITQFAIHYFFATHKDLNEESKGTLSDAQIDEIIAYCEQLESLQEKNREASPQEIVELFLGIKDADQYFHLPDSAASELCMRLFAAGENLAGLVKSKTSKGATLSLRRSPNKGEEKRNNVLYQSKNAYVEIDIPDIDRLTGSNIAAKKFFILSLIKMNAQALNNGTLTRNYITFPLSELVSVGFYSNMDSARKGFKSGMDKLTSFKLKGSVKYSPKSCATITALEVLFTGYRIYNGQCTVFINDRVDWRFLAQYYTILPRYYFSLSNRACDLLYYIFYLARIKKHDINKKGFFTISLRAIQARLNLPSEKENDSPGKTIKDPIDNALEEIEARAAEYADSNNGTEADQDFGLLLVCDDNASISKYLDTGYLQVTIKGNLAEDIKRIAKNEEKAIEKAEEKKAKKTATREAAATKSADQNGVE